MTMNIEDSERLTYSFVTEADAAFLWEVDQDEAVMRYITGGKVTTREEIEGIFIPRLQAYANFPLGWGIWRVTLKETNEDIGWVLVRPMGFFTATADPENLELGWRFKRSFWGKGYATEATLSVRNALADFGIRQFSAVANPANKASIAIMKKMGMKYSHNFHYQDELFDEEVVVYSQQLQNYSYSNN
ncbi:GNAT family N-acetyltransferase [Alteromonas sp. ASW11-130]|uniref:GNAT family N-acetyltransferase n=1 Tax=Alteromonas sp. ASW11-130 TaxID=3015775 RepID=UPI00224201D5|nr:GNAT family N-acetyltransferase [Alteromonas sp. ASW11-130]MCW8091380.1 GNAT family N-acetyltransferase [Alteromonas sp. ASW11-130]